MAFADVKGPDKPAPMPANARKSLFLATTLVGGALGLVGTIVMSQQGQLQPELLFFVLPVGQFLGAVGGFASGTLAMLLLHRRGAGDFGSTDNNILVTVAALAAGTLIYLPLFAWQGDQPPLTMIGGPAAVLAALMAFRLRGGARTISALRKRLWLRIVVGVVSALCGLAVVGWLAFELAPATISPTPFLDSYALLPAADKEEITFRVIALCLLTALAAVITIWWDARNRSGLSDRVALLWSAVIPASIVVIHLNWITSVSTSSLVILHQQESHLVPPVVVFQVFAWLFILLGLGALVMQVLRQHPSVSDAKDVTWAD